MEKIIIFYDMFKYIVFQMRQKVLSWSKGLTLYILVAPKCVLANSEDPDEMKKVNKQCLLDTPAQ